MVNWPIKLLFDWQIAWWKAVFSPLTYTPQRKVPGAASEPEVVQVRATAMLRIVK